VPRLRRSDPNRAGISRRRCGKGFTYRSADGKKIVDAECLARIKALAVPPAWNEVWICPWENGHIQAVGTDAAGRRQYRYHDRWRLQRDEEKFDRVLEFGRALPQLRKTVVADLARPGFAQRRMLAAAVRLLDIGFFRIGGEEYAEEHDTFGVATLQIRHAHLEKGMLVFAYRAKGSVARRVEVADPDIEKLVTAVRRTSRRPKDNLLAWRRRNGEWCDVRSTDVNSYIKEVIGEEFSAKDFRTWSATVLAAADLAGRVDGSMSERERTRQIGSAVSDVAEYLGNTPAVCRSSYIDPRVIEQAQSGETIAKSLGSAVPGGPVQQRRVELAALKLVEDDVTLSA
jgi:DNA topoisomerase I